MPDVGGLSKAAFAMSSEHAEWYTPRYIWHRAYRVLGEIDLDPASDPGHQIPAKKHYTVDDDGLAQVWIGRVWLNPPYGDGVVEWFKKLKSEKGVTEAIVLWKSATETEGWRVLTSIASMVCYPHTRVSFIKHGAKVGNSPTFSPAIYYVGVNTKKFKEVFNEIGQVWDVPEDLECRKQQLLF